MKPMRFFKRVRRYFASRADFIPIFTQHATFLCQSADALVALLETGDPAVARQHERVTRMCEVQGDALMAEFREMLQGRRTGAIGRLELQEIAMSLDDCLDVIKDAAKAVRIYRPARIDPQLLEIAHLIQREAVAMRDMMPLLGHFRDNIAKILFYCDQVKELEHAADDTYEEYIGYIFEKEADLREMTKYKNLAELFEKVTDEEKKVSDDIRKVAARLTQ